MKNRLRSCGRASWDVGGNFTWSGGDEVHEGPAPRPTPPSPVSREGIKPHRNSSESKEEAGEGELHFIAQGGRPRQSLPGPGRPHWQPLAAVYSATTPPPAPARPRPAACGLACALSLRGCAAATPCDAIQPGCGDAGDAGDATPSNKARSPLTAVDMP